jgi:uncharacterized oxidoreductase
MKLTSNTILITGGSEGIGYALAKRLVTDNTVIICGRSYEKLANAKAGAPGLHIETCDITNDKERQAMIERVLSAWPDLNVLINNAGGKYHTDLLSGDTTDEAMEMDMALNFTAPVSLTMAILPHLRAQPFAFIINMTTGLVHLPKAAQTFYCTGKAALHSFSQSLRWTLKGSQVEVYEVLLTLVATNFHQGHIPDNITSISADEAAKLTIKGIKRGKHEVAIGKAKLVHWLALLAPVRGMAIVNK